MRLKQINLEDYIEVPEKEEYGCKGCCFDSGVSTECYHPWFPVKSIGCSDRRIIFAKKDQVQPVENKEYDTVCKPKHYMLFPEKNIEVRDLMQVLADRLESNGYSAMFISDYIQMQQYLLRFDEKNRKEDLEKAQWYLNQLIESKDFDV